MHEAMSRREQLNEPHSDPDGPPRTRRFPLHPDLAYVCLCRAGSGGVQVDHTFSSLRFLIGQVNPTIKES